MAQRIANVDAEFSIYSYFTWLGPFTSQVVHAMSFSIFVCQGCDRVPTAYGPNKLADQPSE
jgi:hypothetical protein